jgi:methylated-DNA-[protein]-cysteine S-methyltransferase
VPIVIETVDAPWGPIRMATTARGIVALEQLVSEEDFVARLERRLGPRALEARPIAAAPGDRASTHMSGAVDALHAFIDGELHALDGLPLDLDDRPPWDRTVLAAVRQIPPGATASYGAVARMAGKPGAARAVGGAVGRNPIGLAIPCHRVIAGDGSLGGYGASWWGGRTAGLELKRELLAREGVRVISLDRGART